jgi:putative FmdB family regulatory protein
MFNIWMNSANIESRPPSAIINYYLRCETKMPIYEYVCGQCGRRCEVVQKVSDPPLKKCRSCGGMLKKILSAPAIQFKGTGWYITDYARKSSTETGEKTKEKGKDKEISSCTDAAEPKKPSPPAAKD